MANVFDDLIRPTLVSVPALEVIHSEWHDGVKFRVTQSVQHNVFNAFDQKLLRHLAATKGTVFPKCQITVQIVDLRSKDEPKYLTPTYHESAPHALKTIAERALARVGPVELVLQRGDCNPGQLLPVSHKRRIDAAYVGLLDQALGIPEYLGGPAFLGLSGEFDRVEIAPPENLDPVVLDLHKGTVLFPSVVDAKKDPFEWPIHSFTHYASSNVAAHAYLASVRNAVVQEKKSAILAFRAAAEQRIHEFDRALAGRRLSGHWLIGALELTARLTAALGASLPGISDDARGRALDWCAEIGRTQKPMGAAANVARTKVKSAPDLVLSEASGA